MFLGGGGEGGESTLLAFVNVNNNKIKAVGTRPVNTKCVSLLCLFVCLSLCVLVCGCGGCRWGGGEQEISVPVIDQSAVWQGKGKT